MGEKLESMAETNQKWQKTDKNERKTFKMWIITKGVASETPQSARSWISSRISHLITQIQRFSSLWRCGYQITWRKWRWGASPPCSPRPSSSTWRAAWWRRHLLRTVGVELPLQQKWKAATRAVAVYPMATWWVLVFDYFDVWLRNIRRKPNIEPQLFFQTSVPI